MTKANIVEAVKATGLTAKQADAAVAAVLDSVKGALAEGDKVQIIGFGTFAVTNRAARTGRNPKTGEPMKIAASKSVGFKAGKALKEAL